MAVGFYFDMTRCTGCRACQVACKDKNRLDVGTLYRTVNSYTVGAFPTVAGYSFSEACNHCENPACIAACSEGAIYKAEDGTVLIDQSLCNGCGNCTLACPYGAPQMLPEGVAGKCDGCYAIRQDGGVPACVGACPCRALDFGDMDELRAKYDGELVSEIAVLPGAELTQPNLLIKAKPAAFDEEFVELNW